MSFPFIEHVVWLHSTGAEWAARPRWRGASVWRAQHEGVPLAACAELLEQAPRGRVGFLDRATVLLGFPHVHYLMLGWQTGLYSADDWQGFAEATFSQKAGIDPEQWSVARAASSPESLRIVTVMRLAPRKRTLPLIRMVAAARHGLTGQVDVTATVVGEGPMLQRARREAASRGAGDAIRFTGRLDRAGILDIFSESDVYVQPSVKESFGLAALEARTAGLPVIARSQSGTTQFIHDGVEGLVVDDDPGTVAAIARLARDRDLLDRLSEHNRTVPPVETWSNVLATVDAAYATAGARPTPH